MRIILIATALILLNPGILLAQQTGTISGSVVDRETGDMLSYTQVALYTWPDSDFVAGTITMTRDCSAWMKWSLDNTRR